MRPRRRVRRSPVALVAAIAASSLLAPRDAWAGPPCVTVLRCTASIAPAGPARLAGASGLAVDHRGRAVVADAGGHRVLILAVDGTIAHELGGYGWADSNLDTPLDVVVTAGFFIDVLDRGNRRVARFDAEGDYVETVVGDDALEDPVALALGRSGEVLVLDGESRSVLVFSQFGEPMPAVGRFGPDDGGLVRPSAVAVGPRGEIAVGDPGRGSVEVFDEFGAHVGSLAPADSLAAVAVAYDRHGNLFAADAARGAVLAFSPSGALTALLDADHVGAPIRPVDVALDREGRALVLDGAGRLLTVAVDYGDCPAPR